MSTITTNDGVDSCYSEVGHGDPVVLIHGMRFSGASWAPIGDRLADKYHVVSFDNRGVGETRAPAGPFSIVGMAHDVVELLDQVVRQPAHILGYSMRGMIAQHLAGRHLRHVRSPALLSTTATTTQP